MAWYTLQVKPHNEPRAQALLGLKEVQTFLPLIEVNRVWRSRRAVRYEPLFPGYLFVEQRPLDTFQRWCDAVRWTPGVRKILGTDGIPTSLADEVIRAIQDRVSEFGFVRPGLPFRRGSRVRVLRGPLAGLEAAFDRPLSRQGRVRILLSLLGQSRGVEIEATDLESA